MAFIPPKVRSTDLIMWLEANGLRHLNSGKVGELFEVSPEYLFIVRTDRLSIFDFVLPATVLSKGAILTAMTVLWLTEVLGDILAQFGGHHLVAYGAGIDGYFDRQELRGQRYLQERGMIIKRMPEPEEECIVRGYLTGSALNPYLADGIVCGHQLPPGLHDGSKLPQIIFAPSTKAKVGHDEHIDHTSVDPEKAEIALAVFRRASEYAEERGILIADTKFEIVEGMLIDEVLTPDSSRLWLKSAWLKAQEQTPPVSPGGFDKELARKTGKTIETPFYDSQGNPIIGIHNLDPENQEHAEFVAEVDFDPQVVVQTSHLYHQCLEMLFGRTLQQHLVSAGVGI